eukprot:SAG11_NODE_4935_length_1718_cov_1.360716_2_plen_253_part_01
MRTRSPSPTLIVSGMGGADHDDADDLSRKVLEAKAAVVSRDDSGSFWPSITGFSSFLMFKIVACVSLLNDVQVRAKRQALEHVRATHGRMEAQLTQLQQQTILKMLNRVQKNQLHVHFMCWCRLSEVHGRREQMLKRAGKLFAKLYQARAFLSWSCRHRASMRAKVAASEAALYAAEEKLATLKSTAAATDIATPEQLQQELEANVAYKSSLALKTHAEEAMEQLQAQVRRRSALEEVNREMEVSLALRKQRI